MNLSGHIMTVAIVLLIAAVFAMIATVYTAKLEDHEYVIFVVAVACTVTATAIVIALESGLNRSD